ncbi:hypothetical protein GRI62_05820 [Erythrobacter arachoides]|uniref:Putative Flp pilus-assembly TadG-like N-terminal domain-containing protein n=2 Tax=Aurantiacibacter arachoides TaxID=1850444 RepID=A0A844ZYA3_9SPHN|nr:Tad domain-containing protein [Aurantiacibacter arachoides]MXO93123.1 hypothetical protein [Aurantiacibacter arachoides]
MGSRSLRPCPTPPGVLSRLARDNSGNVLAIIAASLFPLLALIGGGIDMGRGYLAQSRLQQACDAGVLAARQRLGSEVVVDGAVPDDVADTGNRFFNVNFREGAYGTEGRQFAMALEHDYAIAGSASVEVPTTLMQVFNFEKLDVSVSCEAVLNFGNVDIMMVLDTTGSMRHTNPGDTMSRLDSLKTVIRSFHAQLEGAKAPETSLRYGFVPYASNVNVGHLLADDWVADTWQYQSRTTAPATLQTYTWYSGDVNWQTESGTRSPWAAVSSYPATYRPGSPPAESSGDVQTGGSSGYYTCDGGQPAGNRTQSDVKYNETTEPVTNPDGQRVTQYWRRTQNGTHYRTTRSGTTCTVESSTDTALVQTFQRIWEPRTRTVTNWLYKALDRDVSAWRSTTPGCMEERATYAIGDYDNVDLSRALDLDLDRIPSAGDADSQWRPHHPSAIYARAIATNGTGSFSPADVTTSQTFLETGSWWFSQCPARARKLGEMSDSDLDTYLGTLSPQGATYHDIGMIWGGRLLSPTGLFAGENADTASIQRSRHLIWMTDGQTEPYDLAYGAYGVEPLDRRRWQPGSSMTLAQTIEARFGVACEEVKKRNITVWVIAFGTTLNPIMEDCAGEGHAFEAANAAELNEAFSSIAQSMGDLRVSR